MNRCALRLGLVVACLVSAGVEATEPPALVLEADGALEEVVFDWDRDRCATWDVPDAPARAFRGADGTVHLIASHTVTRAATGTDLDRVQHDCAPLHQSRHDPDPARHDDRVWLAAFFTADGDVVEALAHVEYHGHRHPGRCLRDGYMACWRNSLVGLTSSDGGASFSVAPEQPRVVAALPYAYTGREGRRTGYFNPSNVLRVDDYLYTFVFAEAWEAQRRGVCLLRRPVGGGNADWRAFDGVGFSVRFMDGEAQAPHHPAAHVCTPLPELTATLSSVVRHEPSGLFVAVSPMTEHGADGATRSGIFWRTSSDLVHWSTPRLLQAETLLWRNDCGASSVVAYPSLLDPASTSRHFDRVGDTLWLYIVRMPLDGCSVTPRRHLVRIPVTISDARPAAR